LLLRQVLEVFDLLDRPDASGGLVREYLESLGAAAQVERVSSDSGSADIVRLCIPGIRGKSSGGGAPTLGIIGTLGGVGARPQQVGFVSDGDGALAALAAAAKILDMARKGDRLEGDVMITTNICPDSPTIPHEPVPFMGSHIPMKEMTGREVSPEMDAVLSIDTTKGNRIINANGFAISPTVLQGYILPVSRDLLDIMQRVTGDYPRVFALSTQDITPYANGLTHLNSILQPATATGAPVVGVAVTTRAAVEGCATGATRFQDVEAAARFTVETAKLFGAGRCRFFDEEEFDKLKSLYGSMARFQTAGGTEPV